MRHRQLRFLLSAILLVVTAVPFLYADGGDLRVLDAVKRRDEKTLSVLLRSKADVNAAQPDGSCIRTFDVPVGTAPFAYVRIALDSAAVGDWNEIDAIGIVP